MELRRSRFAYLGPVVQCRHDALLVSSILHVIGTGSESPVWEEELKQDPDRVAEVHEGASAACGLIPLQEISREKISGSLCSMLP